MQDRQLFEETRLPNGIRVFSHSMDVPLFALHVMIPVGSSHSHERNPHGRNGIAHFLEHTVLNRSAKYPELKSFDQFIGAQGGYANASTSVFLTEFVAEAPVEAEKEIVDGMISHIYEPIFKEEDIIIERGVVSNERRQKRWYPSKTELGQYLSKEWLQNYYYPKEQALGSEEDLASFTGEMLSGFRENYLSEDVLVVVSGGHNPEYVKRAFSSIQTKPVALLSECAPMAWGKREYHERSFRDTEHPTYFAGGIAPSYDWETEGLLSFIGSVLTNTYNGALYNWLRREKGWSYSLGWSVPSNTDRLGWVMEIPVNDASVIPEIRKEVWQRSREALANKDIIHAGVERALRRRVFHYQTAEARADAATDDLATSGKVFTEQEVEALLRSYDDPQRIVAAFDKYMARELVGEFVALPEKEDD